MARGITDYLDDWKLEKQSGDSRKNAGGDYSGNVPYQWDANEVHPEARAQEGGYGHGSEVKVTDGAKWDMAKDEVAAGFERLKSDGEGGVLETRQPHGSHPQSLPTENPGNPTERYAREGHGETGAHTGRGQPESTSNPGGESCGSSKLVG
jgi:hypothetical protein